MTKVVINKDFFVYLYYILLLAIYLSWSNFNAVPGPMVRLAYLGATIVPVLFWTRSWFAAVILLFSTLAQNSYSSSYLPSQDYTYLVVVIVALFFVFLEYLQTFLATLLKFLQFQKLIEL